MAKSRIPYIEHETRNTRNAKVAPEDAILFNRSHEQGNPPPSTTWADGVAPLRVITAGEKDENNRRDGRPPSEELVELSEELGTLSAYEQTLGPGLDGLPPVNRSGDGFAGSDVTVAKKAREYVLAMPHPKYEWPSYLLNRRFKLPYDSMRQSGALERRGEINRHHSDDSKFKKKVVLWRTNPEVWRYVYQKWDGRDDKFPCGHAGFSNLGDDVFGCSNIYCTARYTRAEAKEIVFG